MAYRNPRAPITHAHGLTQAWPAFEIEKTPRVGELAPNLSDYAQEWSEFSFDDALASLGLPPACGPNIGFEAADRQTLQFRDQQVAVRWLSSFGLRIELTYGELALLSSRFANTLARLGVRTGQAVSTLLGRVPALYAVAAGTLKHRAVFAPLSPELAPETLTAQLELADARVLVTTRRLYRTKLQRARAAMPTVEHVLLIDEDTSVSASPGTLSYSGLMRSAGTTYAPGETRDSNPAFLHFHETDRTAQPLVHAHESAVLLQATGHYALDLHPGDVYFPAFEPGTLLGTAYGIVAPLMNRATVVLDDAPFSAERCYDLLFDEGIMVFHSSPQAIAKLMAAGRDAARDRQFPGLRFAACSGSGCDADAVTFIEPVLGRPLHASLFEPTFGVLVLANFRGLPLQPGAIGKPVPGMDAAVMRQREDALERAPDGHGELALRLRRGDERWFGTGRRAYCDDHGDYWLLDAERV